MTDAAELLRELASGERRPLARLLTRIEANDPSVRALLPQLFRAGHGAHVVGVTGPPGSGKSTLVNALTAEWRRRGRRVGILAIDPSSPYTGGSIMGDRIRMMEHAADRDVFMRSMASRGELGGLAAATWLAVAALDAAGYDPIVIETVGAGQSEVEIARLAETTVVVEVPDMGDEVQAIKAGLLEVADVIAVNKGDRPGADRAARQLRAMLSTAGGRVERKPPPVLLTIATTADGVAALADAIEKHRSTANQPDQSRIRAQNQLRRAISDRALAIAQRRPDWESAVEALAKRELDPITAADQLLNERPPAAKTADREGTLRWFTDEVHRGDHSVWSAMLAAYDAHIREIADRLPADLAALATHPQLTLHDARIRSVVVDKAASTVEMNMTTALDQGLRDRDLKLVFGGASFVPEDLSSVAYAVEATYASGDWGTTRTVILASEVDIADNGRYLLRFRLWPFHTFALAFHTLSLSEEPATPDDGRPGSFTFTNEDDD